MTEALFTILLPVNRPPDLLPFAVESVLAQSERRFRLCILSDGAPPETVEVARSFATRDTRIEVFAFEKGERHGEAHRHHVLTAADTEFVAQIGDDDLWFPDYLKELAKALEHADFGNLPQVEMTADGTCGVIAGSLGLAVVRERMLTEMWNLFGPTFAGYRLAAYRRLPVGWSPAPSAIWTDLFMWRKFLSSPDFRFATRFSIQGLKFAAHTRTSMSLEERALEIRDIAARLKSPLARAELQIQALEALADRQCFESLELAEQKFRAEYGRLQSLHAQQQSHWRSRMTEIAQATVAVRQTPAWPILKKVGSVGQHIDRISELASSGEPD